MFSTKPVSAAAVTLLAAVVTACSLDTAGTATIPDVANNSYQCECTCAGGWDSQATSRPTASEDDAEETLATGSMLLADEVLDLGSAGADPQAVGIRFPGLVIPAGSTILSAHVQLTAGEATSATTSLVIRGETSANASAFSSSAGSVSGRWVTGAQVAWAPGPWDFVGEAGASQRTPDLAPILTEIIGSSGWAVGNAIVLVITGTGRRAARSFDADPAQAPWLEVTFTGPAIDLTVAACMPAALNPNLGGSPTEQDIASDCTGRVGQTIQGMAGACGYPSSCSCAVVADSYRFATECDSGCTGEALASDCSNFDPEGDVVTATHAGGGQPVCTTTSPLSSALYGKRSRCEVSGNATVKVEDEDDKHPAASGVVELKGDACPGGTCDLGMSYRLRFGDVTYDSFWGSVTLDRLTALGGSLADTSVASGTAIFEPNSTLSSGRGRRDEEDTMGIIAPNSQNITVGVDWVGKTCTVEGAVVGNVSASNYCENAGPDANDLCTSDADCADHPACTGGLCDCLPVPDSAIDLSLDISGSLGNQPPATRAGDDLVVECNLPDAARFALDGSATTDPDANLAAMFWFLGSRSGPVTGPSVEQALDTTRSYVLRAIDTLAQADEDTMSATVVDTTPPTVFCNAPVSITPPNAPITFTATAVDVCDRELEPAVSELDCYMIAPNGKIIDKSSSCVASLAGGEITILDSGGVGDHIAWKAASTDDSGNTGTIDCEIEVVRPKPK